MYWYIFNLVWDVSRLYCCECVKFAHNFMSIVNDAPASENNNNFKSTIRKNKQNSI